MPRFYSLQTPGAPTFTAKSASLNLSGRDEFALSIDPDVMDREWYHSQDYYPHNPLHGHSPLSPADDVLTTVGFSYPSHTVPASDALAGMSSPSLYRRRLLLFPQFLFFSRSFRPMRLSDNGPSTSAMSPSCHTRSGWCWVLQTPEPFEPTSEPMSVSSPRWRARPQP
jgi:hypothetical protein